MQQPRFSSAHEHPRIDDESVRDITSFWRPDDPTMISTARRVVGVDEHRPVEVDYSDQYLHPVSFIDWTANVRRTRDSAYFPDDLQGIIDVL